VAEWNPESFRVWWVTKIFWSLMRILTVGLFYNDQIFTCFVRLNTRPTGSGSNWMHSFTSMCKASIGRPAAVSNQIQWFLELTVGHYVIMYLTAVDACSSCVILFCMNLCHVGILTHIFNQVITTDHVSKTTVQVKLQIS
jgi:hypothetical protein